MQLLHLFISPEHNFFGHHGMEPGTHPMVAVQKVECVAGEGIRGDRFFGYKKGYKGQITFFSFEVYQALCEKLKRNPEPSVFRRNVITQGVNLNNLIGEEFTIQGVCFRGMEECKPCHWMDEAFAPGAHAGLKGNGGLRAQIISSGEIQVL